MYFALDQRDENHTVYAFVTDEERKSWVVQQHDSVPLEGDSDVIVEAFRERRVRFE